MVIADREMLLERARTLGHQVPAFTDGAVSIDDRPRLHHVSCSVPVTPGQLNPANAAYVLATLRQAAIGCLNGDYDAVVTGPVHKSIINAAGTPFSGHTEFFAECAGVAQPVMLLVADQLRVALATTHLSLREVPAALSEKSLITLIRCVHQHLVSWFGIAAPLLTVCGLNPHAGEDGYLGREEIDIIAPALARCRADGLRIAGPVPADTAFTPVQRARTHAYIAMYHDQGLPVLKALGFGSAVNVTLGLPFVRTSVDHGTALDLAGTNRLELGSFRAAVKMAIEIAQRRRAAKNSVSA